MSSLATMATQLPSFAAPLEPGGNDRFTLTTRRRLVVGEGRKDYYKVVSRSGEISVLFHESNEKRWYLHAAAQPNAWPLT